jgi:hypothetical protein
MRLPQPRRDIFNNNITRLCFLLPCFLRGLKKRAIETNPYCTANIFIQDHHSASPRVIRPVSNASQEAIYRRDKNKMSAATTPHRTNIATQHSPSKTPARRALGHLTPKAINTSSEVARAQSPLKQATTHAPTAHADKENLATPKGKKRSIDEVDSAETVENLKMLARGRDDSLLNTGMRLTTDAMQQHTVACLRHCASVCF